MNDQYSELYPTYQWLVPSQFNIAQACVHRWAENPMEGRRIALYHEDELGQRKVWTYSRLSETTNQLANGLIKMGVQPGDRVAVFMGQRPETVASYAAIFSVGAVAMPLSASVGADGLATRLRDADARVAIVDATTIADLLQAQTQCPALSQIIGLDFEHEAAIPWRSLLARQPSDFKMVPTRSSSPALLLYTSETTGAPKGALLAHQALIGVLPGFVASHNWFPQKGDIFWSPAEWNWTGGLMDALFPTLYFGHAIVGTSGRFSPDRAFETMSRYQVSNAFLTPSALKQMMQAAPTAADIPKLALRALMVSGESMGQAVREWCGRVLGVEPNEMFGQTEMNYIVGNSHRKWPAKPGSMGRPYPGHQIAVLDSRGKPCPPNTVGEIALNRHDIHGYPDPVLFLGYWRDEAGTQAKFQGDWCLSGDLASVDADGYYWYAGRVDDIFKSSGRQIRPGEIEDCLLHHDAVANAAIVPTPDAARGAVVKAYVVLAAGVQPDKRPALETELRNYVKDRLTAYRMPREIEFVDSLPLTGTGKIRRHVLRAREQQRKP